MGWAPEEDSHHEYKQCLGKALQTRHTSVDIIGKRCERKPAAPQRSSAARTADGTKVLRP